MTLEGMQIINAVYQKLLEDELIDITDFVYLAETLASLGLAEVFKIEVENGCNS